MPLEAATPCHWRLQPRATGGCNPVPLEVATPCHEKAATVCSRARVLRRLTSYPLPTHCPPPALTKARVLPASHRRGYGPRAEPFAHRWPRRLQWRRAGGGARRARSGSLRPLGLPGDLDRALDLGPGPLLSTPPQHTSSAHLLSTPPQHTSSAHTLSTPPQHSSSAHASGWRLAALGCPRLPLATLGGLRRP